MRLGLSPRLAIATVVACTLHLAEAAAQRAVTFSVTEGTWLNVDVSPDGTTLVFDLLGDLYTLPIGGGQATRITSGNAYDTQARWAPDGRSIAFASDRTGSDNVWVVAPDGTPPRAVTSERDGGLTAPSWAPDGEYIVARKDSTLNRRGSAELWLYHRTGGRGVALTSRSLEGGTFNPNGPVFSPDGRWIYFSHGHRVLDFTWVPWQIWRLDRHTGDVSQVTTGYRGAVRPAVSPNGRHAAFVRRDHARSVLVLRDLDTGAERDIHTGLDRDDQRGTTDYDAYPGFDFMPDGASVVIWTGGQFHRVNVDGSGSRLLAFKAGVALDLPERPVQRHRVSDDPVTARIVRWAQFTPQNQVVFETLGKIWIAGADGKPSRLTTGTGREYAPAVSPDGQWVAFVTWDDMVGGHLWKVRLAVGGRQPQRLTQVARQYANPAWSPDGSKIVLSWRPPNAGSTANVWEDDAWHSIVWLPSAGGETQTVTTVRPRTTGRWYPIPRFSADGSRVYFLIASSATRNDLVSTALDGTNRRAHARFRYVEDAAVSPDGRRLAFVSMDDVYVTDLPPPGTEPVEIDLDRPAVPLVTVTRDGGGYLNWSADGRQLSWCYADIAYRMPAGAPTAAPGDTSRPEAVRLQVTAPRATAEGSTLLRGARLITMKGAEVIERGDVLVTGGRIAAIGRSGSVREPAGARVVDVQGKSIIPGLIDVHWHGHYQGQEIFPQHKWQYLADLAYGTTTGREVSAPTRDTMAQADMVETGDLLGPRVFGTGWPLFAGREGGQNQVVIVESLEDARRHVRRLKRSGVTWLKQYLQPRREQRQWLRQAAAEEGLMITAEGGGLKVQTTLMLDGFTNFEHGIPVAPLYQDMIQLLARSGTAYTPTFVAGYAKPGSMDYYYATERVHDDPRASRFMPHDLLDRFTSIRILIPDDQYHYRVAARSAYEVQKAGGQLAVGGHGNHPGLGMHWELWSFVDGGMPPMDALRAATLGGAELLGVAEDLGSLEPGKIADLVVLNVDPRVQIRKTIDVHRVMKAGHLYDPDDLAKRLPFEARR